MKTIDLSAEPRTLHELLTLASEESLVLRTPDGQEYLLAQVDDLDDEIERISQNQELMEFLESRSKSATTFTLDEVRRQLGL